MTHRTLLVTAFFGSLTIANSALSAAPVLMSADWATTACDGWNASPTLTNELTEWSQNNGGRSHKVMHLYRSDCSDSATAELRISEKEGKAICTYGGAVESTDLDRKTDYIMNAKTANWQRMGAGQDGAMKAMMMGRLKFKGPKGEAMKNMGPFGAFLRLTGEVPGDINACP